MLPLISENDRQYINDVFFIIDNHKLDTIKSKLYGYALIPDKKYDKPEYNFYEPEKLNGVYNFVEYDDKYIRIYQDYFGQAGLFRYSLNGHSIFSNSFYYLLEYISSNSYPATINYELVKYMLSEDVVSLSAKETAIKEISQMPRNTIVHINKINKSVNYEYLPINNDIYPADSFNCIKILDEWHNRWQNIIKYLINNFHVQQDLSGGFDTRSVLSLSLGADIDKSKINFSSATDKTHAEDLQIAQKIANLCEIQLNRGGMDPSFYHTDNQFNIFRSFCSKFLIGNQIFSSNLFFDSPKVVIHGACWDVYAGRVWPSTKEEFLKSRTFRDTLFSFSLSASIRNILSRSLDDIARHFNCDISKSIVKHLYTNTRLRHHYGYSAVDAFLHNIYTISPLLDPALQHTNYLSENNDGALFYALIFERYLPSEISSLPVQGGRKINPQTMAIAKQISSKFPLNKKTPSQDIILRSDISKKPGAGEKIILKEHYKKIYLSDDFKNKCLEIFGPGGHEIYKWALSYFKNQPFMNDIHFNALQYIFVLYELFRKSNPSPINSDKNNGNYLRLLKLLATLNLDIQLSSEDCGNIILCSTPDITDTSPAWFKNQTSVGRRIFTEKNDISISFKCVQKGILKILLRASGIRDADKKMLPILMNCLEFSVNGNTIYENIVFSHNAPAVYSAEVRQEEVIHLHIKFLPHFQNPEILGMVAKNMQELNNFPDPWRIFVIDN